MDVNAEGVNGQGTQMHWQHIEERESSAANYWNEIMTIITYKSVV